MALHLVRHAKAGSRSDWAQPDELRPLTAGGQLQADAIAELLRPRPVKRILSSRFVRCIQTVTPLADALGLEVEEHPALSEEADLDDTWALLAELAGTEAVLCSHGNVIPEVVERALRSGTHVVSDRQGNKKGSVWTLELDGDGTVTTAAYTPPPA
jgi:8-oxo-dGTP diphosphatase